MSGANARVVTLIDMDCFYCQVEARLNPVHSGKPLAVVQYNQWKGGGIIAVNYEARDKGVKRGMRGDEAKQKCPDIVLVSVASVRGKADLSKYRDAGKEVVDVFKEFCDCVERASIDEAYLDLTQVVERRSQKILDSGTQVTPDLLGTTFVVGFCPDDSNAEDLRTSGVAEFLEDQKYNPETLRLAVAAAVVEELRAAVLKHTGFHCSAGIAHNKILAKLVCGIHKPRRQTVLPSSCVEQLFSALPVHKVRNLGGKFGSKVVEELGCQTMGDLAKYSKEYLQQQFDEKTGSWLYEIARGIDNDPVTPRLIPKSIGCSKNFPGRNSLKTKEEVEHWMKELCDEVGDRLNQDLLENKRRAQLLTVTISLDGQSTSRSSALQSYDAGKIAAEALSLISRCNTAPANSSAWQPTIKMIALSTSKFLSDEGFRCTGIQSFFKQTAKNVQTAQNVQTEADSGNSSEVKENTITNNPSKPTVKAPAKINSFFKSQPQKPPAESKSAVEHSLNSEVLPEKAIENSNLKEKPSENSFFLNYLHRLKSESVQNKSTPESTIKSISSDNCVSSRSNNNLNSPVKKESDKSENSLNLIKEMFPNPLEVEESVVNLLSTSLQETFYTWRSVFRRENGFLSPEKNQPNSRKNGLNKIPVDFTSPKKQQENQKSIKPKPKGSIDIFFQKDASSKEQFEPEPEPCSSVSNRKSSEPESESRPSKPQHGSSVPPPGSSEAQPGCSYRYPVSEDSNSCDFLVVDENSCDAMERCSICHEMILLREFPEHVDYHAAVSLDEKLNKSGDPPSSTAKAPVVQSAPKTAKAPVVQSIPKPANASLSSIPVKKRGRPPKNESLRPKNNKKLKSISSFFSVKGST